jgi:hypothetical protein
MGAAPLAMPSVSADSAHLIDEVRSDREELRLLSGQV